MYVKRNIEACLCNHCCCGQAMNIIQRLGVRVCVCVGGGRLRYLACYTHAPYCHLCPALLYNIFPHFPINRTIFGK
jgi:hypothetical protein